MSQQQHGLTFRAVSERAYTRRHHLPGSAASPTFAFDDARGTGFFLANIDTGMMGVAVNGEQKMLLGNNITFDGDIEITGNLVTGEGNVALDFGNIGQSLVPAEDATCDQTSRTSRTCTKESSAAFLSRLGGVASRSFSTARTSRACFTTPRTGIARASGTTRTVRSRTPDLVAELVKKVKTDAGMRYLITDATFLFGALKAVAAFSTTGRYRNLVTRGSKIYLHALHEPNRTLNNFTRFWPKYVPFACQDAETDDRRKEILNALDTVWPALAGQTPRTVDITSTSMPWRYALRRGQTRCISVGVVR